MVSAASFSQFPDFFCFVCRVRLSPVRAAVIRVVLGPVDISVHLELSVEVYEGQPHFMRPRRAVESFDDSPVGKVWPVADGHVRQTSVLQELPEGLYSIEGTGLIPAGNHDALA